MLGSTYFAEGIQCFFFKDNYHYTIIFQDCQGRGNIFQGGGGGVQLFQSWGPIVFSYRNL